MSTVFLPKIAVHLIALDLTSEVVGDGTGLASGDLYRAITINCPRERAGFLAGRRVLRRLLADQLGCAAEEVPITVTPCGKPQLSERGPQFSVGRWDRWCAIALSEDCPVGVDVEPIRPLEGLDAVIAQFFPEDARSSLARVESTERLPAFFRWWTRLEAAAKACGAGLDAGAACMKLAPQRSNDAVPGIALAVAAVTNIPFAVEWYLLGRSLSGNETGSHQSERATDWMALISDKP